MDQIVIYMQIYQNRVFEIHTTVFITTRYEKLTDGRAFFYVCVCMCALVWQQKTETGREMERKTNSNLCIIQLIFNHIHVLDALLQLKSSQVRQHIVYTFLSLTCNLSVLDMQLSLFTLAHSALNSSYIDVDRMSHIERSERAGRQGQRRKHHRLSGPDHFHSDSRLVRL